MQHVRGVFFLGKIIFVVLNVCVFVSCVCGYWFRYFICYF